MCLGLAIFYTTANAHVLFEILHQWPYKKHLLDQNTISAFFSLLRIDLARYVAARLSRFWLPLLRMKS